MHSADWRTNGSCISPAPNRSPTTFIPARSMSLTMARAGVVEQGLVEVGGEAVAVAVDDALLQPALDRPAAAVLLHQRRRRHPLEQLQQLLQGVVAGLAPVVDQVEAHPPLLLGDLVEGHDAGRVDDGRVEPGLDALVEVDRVEDVAGGRREPEGHVRQAEDGGHAGQLGLDELDALDGLDAVPPALLHARRQGEGEGVEDQVGRLHAVAVDGDVVDGLGRPQLPRPRCGPGPPGRCRCRRRPPRTPGPG